MVRNKMNLNETRISMLSFGKHFFCWLTCILLVTACGSDDDDSIENGGTNNSVASQMSYVFLQNGLNAATVSSQDAGEYTYSLSINKAGVVDFEANVSLRPWTEEEMKAYNAANGISYVAFSSERYTISSKDVSLAKGESSKTVDVKFKSTDLFKALKENNTEYVIPLRLESTDMKVQESRQNMILYLSLDAPRVEFVTCNYDATLAGATLMFGSIQSTTLKKTISRL